MGKICISLAIFCFSAFSLFPQQQNLQEKQQVEESYRAFKDFFESKDFLVTDSVVKEEGLSHFSHPERLPVWLFQPPETAADSMYIIGVSDPGMNETQGLDLALKRVLLMAMFSGENKVSNMRENYTQEAGEDVAKIYSEFTQFSSLIELTISDICVDRVHITQYEETIILARIPRAKAGHRDHTSSLSKMEAGWYTRVSRLGNRIRVDEQLKIDIKPVNDQHDNTSYAHRFQKINRIVNAETMVNDTLMAENPALNLRYVAEGEQAVENTKTNKSGQNLRNGLWHALLSGMLNKMADEVHMGSLHFRQVNDLYDQLLVFLSREFVTQRVQSPLPSLSVKDNQLFLNFNQ